MTTRHESPPYELSGRLGHGGMGVVYQGRKLLFMGDSIPIAVKVMRPKDFEAGDKNLDGDGVAGTHVGADESTVRLFRREGRASLCMNHEHANLVTVFDYGVSSKGYPYLIMELVDGANLGDVARLEGPQFERLPFAVVRRIAIDVLAALEHMHARGQSHRDVKPGNILLSRSGGVKLADFGLIKGMRRPGSGCFRGTPGYASPEALLDRPLCATSDLYSLGVVLHELLTGTLMNGTGNPNAVMHAMETRQATPLPEDTPDDLGSLIVGITEYQPTERVFQTATEALEFLEEQGQVVANDEEIARLVAMRSPARDANAGKLPALGWPFDARALPRQGWQRLLPWSLVPVACMLGALVFGSWFADSTRGVYAGAEQMEEQSTSEHQVDRTTHAPNGTSENDHGIEPESAKNIEPAISGLAETSPSPTAPRPRHPGKRTNVKHAEISHVHTQEPAHAPTVHTDGCPEDRHCYTSGRPEPSISTSPYEHGD